MAAGPCYVSKMKAAAVALLVAVAALALVGTVQAGFYFTAEDLESDEALWELYGRWAAHHEVVREPGRFATCKANAHSRLHRKQRHAGALMALNVFGDRTFDEVMSTMTGLREPEEAPVVDLDGLLAIAAKRALPNEVDRRSANNAVA